MRDSYFLQWKGKVSGPFTLQEIRTKLDLNEIGLLHTVRDAKGANSTVEEFLQAALKREDQERMHAEQERLAAGQNFQREIQVHPPEYAAHQAPPPPISYPHPQQSGAAPSLAATTATSKHVSVLAVTSLILALLHFGVASISGGLELTNAGATFYAPVTMLLEVNLLFCSIALVLALVFGHIALLQTNRDPSLEGHGMALAALVITYCVLAIGVIAGIFYMAGKNT